MSSETIKALANITDEGLFEQLALAVLHCDEPLSACLGQQGINAAGKIKASPVDNIGFVRGAEPPHMVMAHHTIAAARDLRVKWLGGISPRARRAATRREGDIEKTSRVVQKQRLVQPRLKATLFLTTNEEPDVPLAGDVAEASANLGIEIDIWSRARIARVLDTNATGQWLRASLLGIDQQWASPELLTEVSRESIDEIGPPEATRQWVARALDRQLAASNRAATFIIGASGAGKSVAALRQLKGQLAAGGYALVLPHPILESAPSLSAAVLATLQRFRPALTGHIDPMSFCTTERPLALLVEDINHASNPGALLEKITRWASEAGKEGKIGHWRIICPMWPRTLNSASDAIRRTVESASLYPDILTLWEAADAVKARYKAASASISEMAAQNLATELGFDPLLIALHEPGMGPVQRDVIERFVEQSLLRCEAKTGRPASELHSALHDLGEKMLEHCVVAPTWRETAAWQFSPETRDGLRDIAAHGELLRLVGPSSTQAIAFRHDRVRDHLLTQSATGLFDERRLQDALIGNPYFAEIIARLLVARPAAIDLLACVEKANPLALFHALRIELARSGSAPLLAATVARWLTDPPNRGPDTLILRYHIAGILYETEGAEVPGIAKLLPESTRHLRFARLRNGDLDAGIEDCTARNFYSRDVWHKRQIDHAKIRHGTALLESLSERLRDPSADGKLRSALLNLAGDFAEPVLADAIQACRALDDRPAERLEDYLWALSYCCTGDTARDLLGPLCDEWAALPTETTKQGMPGPRHDLIDDSMRWAFERNPPDAAIAYFAERGQSEDLNWPIYYMLHGVDQPAALAFCVSAMAAGRERNEQMYFVNYRNGSDVWERRRDEQGEYMSAEGRSLLSDCWQDATQDQHKRVAAFDLWAASWAADDLKQMRCFHADMLLSDRILRKRLERGDATAIPALIDKLDGDQANYWWFCTRYVPSTAVATALEQQIERIARDGDADSDSHIGWELANALVRLPVALAEPILLRFQHALSRSPRFVQCALYFATPALIEFARSAIAAAPEPAKMVHLLTSHFGIKERDHPGVTRPEQIRGLHPYFHLLDSHELERLAEACNSCGWFDLRLELLDPLLLDARACWTIVRLPSLYDRMVTDQHFISHRLDEAMGCGISWDEMVAALGDWLSVRDNEAALRLAGKILEDRGLRRDLLLLKCWIGQETETSRAIVANATFSACQRSACA